MILQTALEVIYPNQCVLCGEMVDQAFSLCAPCWRNVPFIDGLSCNLCGQPLPGHSDVAETCDDCRTIARPWTSGRAAMRYAEEGRRLVLSLKHGDRLDLARPAAEWMRRAGGPLFQDNPLLVPVPLHWTRLLKRRYNQSAVLAQHIARAQGVQVIPDALIRVRRTAVQDGKSVEQRFENLASCLRPHPRRGAALSGRNVVLIDDVMTSGATLAAATEACLSAGASRVSVLVLARVCKDA